MSIDQLPTELLTIIFKHVCTQNLLPEYSTTNQFPDRPPTRLSSPLITYLPALAVSAVCARWRVLGLALPSLWAHLKLEIVETATASNGIMATLQLYLERSAEAPLSLDILIGFTQEFAYGDDVQLPVLDLLLKHTSRWKTVLYSHDRRLSEDPLFPPILEDLALDCSWDESEIRTQFNATPEIRTLVIHDADLILDWSKLYRPTLTHLTVLALDMMESYLGSSIEADMVGDLPNLRVLNLGVLPGKLVGNILPRFFPQVKSFTLQLENSSNKDSRSENSLDLFMLPSLDEFIIRPAQCHSTKSAKLIWPVRAFSEFLSRSSCTLTHLSINGIVISDVDFIAALQLLPSLTRLGFDDYHIKDKKIQKFRSDKPFSSWVKNPITSFFLSELTIRSVNPDPGLILVPLLQSLSIKLQGNSFDDASFVKMGLSRWLPDPSYEATNGVASLRSLVLRLHERVVDEDIYMPLFKLDKVGMRWGREVKEEENLRPVGNLERMGMRVVITGKEYTPDLSTLTEYE